MRASVHMHQCRILRSTLDSSYSSSSFEAQRLCHLGRWRVYYLLAGIVAGNLGHVYTVPNASFVHSLSEGGEFCHYDFAFAISNALARGIVPFFYRFRLNDSISFLLVIIAKEF